MSVDSRYHRSPSKFTSNNLSLDSKRFRIYRNFFKRLLDVALVLAAIPAIFPIIFMLATIIRRDGGSPFYFQSRVGRGGKTFKMYKLRSMVVDADQKLEAYLSTNPSARQEWDLTQKLKADPRITSMGKLLRKLSLDELPQLWNVLTGDMSLVGPRPMMIDQRDLYPGRTYFTMRPGLTGLWQISDRNESSFADRAKFDDKYNETLSIATDVSILFATIGVVIRGTGY